MWMRGRSSSMAYVVAAYVAAYTVVCTPQSLAAFGYRLTASEWCMQQVCTAGAGRMRTLVAWIAP